MPRRRNRDRPMTARLRRVRKSLDYSIDRLARDLAEDGESVERDDDGTVLLLGDRGGSWDPPVQLAFTDDELRRYLLSMGDDAKGVFGDLDAVQAAYQLFLVHLDEELATAATAGSRITMDANRLEAYPVREPEPWPDLDPEGDYTWVADRPDEPTQNLEFMSPEQYTARYRAEFGREPDLSHLGRRPPEA
jgi:hypothetical protein